MIEYILNPYILINVLYMITAVIIAVILTNNNKQHRNNNE